MQADDELLQAVEELEKRKQWEFWKNNPDAFINECLYIYPKDAALGKIKLKINKAQKLVVDEFIKQMEDKGYVRMIISKYRQAGFSTISSALIFHRALFYTSTRAVIISLDKPTTESIFSMSKTFFEDLPEDIKPELSASNKREMKFLDNGSMYRCFTAGADNPGRGTTNTALLCDETAFFQSAEKVMAGLFQSISLSPGSIIIINSTSNGAQGVYYDLWNKAEKNIGNFTSLFVPWYIQDEYRIAVPDNLELDSEEKKIKEEWNLDNEQIYWRRIKIAETSTILFKQEYPFTAQESFIQSGSNVFDVEVINQYISSAPESIRTFNRDYASFDENIEGDLQVWEPPKRDKKYIIGGDVAGGVGGDYSAAVVMDSERNVVALYRNNRIDPVFFGHVLFYLGRWYNNCLLVPESNSIGLATIQQLHSMNYPNLYQQRKTANVKYGDGINSFGFKTTVSTKVPIISNLQSMIKDYDINIPSSLILDELRNYILVGDNNRMQAATGHYDDTVMALAITCEAYRTHSNSLTNQRFSFGELNQHTYADQTNWL
tara:strand:- start:3479 stop:5119 length:1641 start_codon:yes stop_codon:yes gene_type:complete